MKRTFRAVPGTTICASTDFSDLESKIENLLDSEEIPYIYVNVEEDYDDDQAGAFVVTYGDWRNDNDRAGDLLQKHFHPDEYEMEEKDPYDYLDEDVAARYEGTDSCVCMHRLYWNR